MERKNCVLTVDIHHSSKNDNSSRATLDKRIFDERPTCVEAFRRKYLNCDWSVHLRVKYVRCMSLVDLIIEDFMFWQPEIS